MKIRIGRFRAYNTNLLSGGTNKTSSDGGSTTSTSSSGGATTSSSGGATTTSSGGGATTSSGGGSNTTSGSGGGTNTTSGSGGQTTSGPSSVTTTGQTQVSAGSVQIEDDLTNIGKHNHGIPQGYRVLLTSGNNLVPNANAEWRPSGAHNHGTHSHSMSHTHTLSTHTHSVTIQNHTHSISINAHTHNVSDHTHSIGNHTHTIGNHTHTLTLGNHNHTVDTSHTHDITPKISFFGNPTQFALLINDVQKQIISGTDAELDLTQYLVGSDGKIPRGQWITIGVRPNDIAYVEVAYNIKGFCQSRGDTTV